MKGKGSAAVAVELLLGPGRDRRVQVRPSRGPGLAVLPRFGPLLLWVGRRDGSPTAAVLAARDCMFGMLGY